MKTKVKCAVCDKEELVYDSRLKNYVTCSRACSSSLKISKKVNNCTCTNCGTEFHRKESQMKRYGKLGFFCNLKCAGEYKRKIYLGENNPNFRGTQYDSDGYRINHYPKVGREKEHRYVAQLCIKRKIPKGFVVHHKDCNIYNNKPDNLCILSESDHRWLHKQFGNATLWAIQNGKISINTVYEWATDKLKALYLLDLDLQYQMQHRIMSYKEYRGFMDRIRQQLIIMPYPAVEFVESDDLTETERGDGSYGSTGK